MGSDDFSLRDKAALVIGAGSSIGAAAAIALAEAGAEVTAATTLPTTNERTTVEQCGRRLRQCGRQGLARTLDASRETEVNELIDEVALRYGRLDVLVNAHDVPFAKPLPDISPTEWRRVLDVNLTGVYLACHAAARPMLSRSSGRIINVVSLLGERGMVNGSAYCAAQAGVLNLTRALALEWARRGITVNAIGAGWTEGMGMLRDEPTRDALIRYLPHQRLARPDEIGDAAVYLASDSSAFITGQVIWIDGAALSHL